MPISSRLPMFESFEDRQHFAAHPSATTVPLAAVRVSLGADTALRVTATDGNDSIRIRGTANGRTQIDITSIQTLPAGSVVFTSPAPAAASPTEHVFSVDVGGQSISRIGNLLQVTRRYTVRTAIYSNIAIDGGGGHDVLRLFNLPRNPVATSIEHVLLTQITAPAGETPSDVAGSKHYGPTSDWAKEVAAQKARADASSASIAFVGDSHAAFYLKYGLKDWQKTFGNALNLGLPGDGTRQLLARVKDGLFDIYKPRKLIVMIGTNNFNHPTTSGTDEQIYRGMTAVIAALRAKLPRTKLVLVGLLPEHEAGVNDRVVALNTRMTRLAAINTTFSYMNPFSHFVGNPVQTALIRNDDHMTPAGYDVMTDLLTAFLKSL